MEAGKPVIASMGDVAASGGYMLAAPCSRILAQPGTVTGSIGVIMGKVCCGVFLMCVCGGGDQRPCSRILAQPGTVTGSIGVIMGKVCIPCT